MLKGLMNTHNAQQHQGISLRRRVALLRHQHSDNDFNDSDHCAKLDSGPPQKQISDGPQPMMKFQTQTPDFIKGEPMKFQTQTSDFINT